MLNLTVASTPATPSGEVKQMLGVGRTARRSRVPQLQVNSVEGGLHLKDSVLSLDVYDKACLSFVSSAKTTLKTLGARRIIATEETAHIIEALRKKKLTP